MRSWCLQKTWFVSEEEDGGLGGLPLSVRGGSIIPSHFGGHTRSTSEDALSNNKASSNIREHVDGFNPEL